VGRRKARRAVSAKRFDPSRLDPPRRQISADAHSSKPNFMPLPSQRTSPSLLLRPALQRSAYKIIRESGARPLPRSSCITVRAEDRGCSTVLKAAPSHGQDKTNEQTTKTRLLRLTQS
jgi:hypothetical protein